MRLRTKTCSSTKKVSVQVGKAEKEPRISFLHVEQHYKAYEWMHIDRNKFSKYIIRLAFMCMRIENHQSFPYNTTDFALTITLLKGEVNNYHRGKLTDHRHKRLKKKGKKRLLLCAARVSRPDCNTVTLALLSSKSHHHFWFALLLTNSNTHVHGTDSTRDKLMKKTDSIHFPAAA